MAYGIFSQGLHGMVWLANAETEAEARAQIEAGDFDHPDVNFVFAIPGLVAFRDLDGVRKPDGTLDGDPMRS